MVSSALNLPTQVAYLGFWSVQLFLHCGLAVLGLDLYSYFTLLFPCHANPITRVSEDFLNSALTPLFCLVKATVTKGSPNQLTCISVWWELSDPTSIPLDMGLCPSQSQGHVHFSQTKESIAYYTIWLLYLSLPTLFPEERITSLGKTLPSSPQINGVGFFLMNGFQGCPIHVPLQGIILVLMDEQLSFEAQPFLMPITHRKPVCWEQVPQGSCGRGEFSMVCLRLCLTLVSRNQWKLVPQSCIH